MNPSIETIAKHEFDINFDRVYWSDDGTFLPKSVLYHKVNPLESQYKLEEDQHLIDERREQNFPKTFAKYHSWSSNEDEHKKWVEKKRIYISELECLKYDYDGQDLTKTITYERDYLAGWLEWHNNHTVKRARYRPPYHFHQCSAAILRIIYTMIYLKRHLELPATLYEERKNQVTYGSFSINKIFSILEDLIPIYRYAALCLIDCKDFSIIEKLSIELEVGDEERFYDILNNNADKCDLSKLNTICHYYDAFSSSVLSTLMDYVQEYSRGARSINVDFIKTYPICHPLQEALMRTETVCCFLKERDKISEEEAREIKRHFKDIYKLLLKEHESWNYLDDSIRESMEDLFHISPLFEYSTEVGNLIGLECSPLINCPDEVYAIIVAMLQKTWKEAEKRASVTEIARILVAVEQLRYFPKKALHNQDTEPTLKKAINDWLNKVLKDDSFIKNHPNFWNQTLKKALSEYQQSNEGKVGVVEPRINAPRIEMYKKQIEKVKNAVERREQDVESTAEE